MILLQQWLGAAVFVGLVGLVLAAWHAMEPAQA
jgi:hypothetical protein